MEENKKENTMRRLLGVTEMRKLLESGADVYEIVDTVNQKAALYVFEVTMNAIQKDADATARKLRNRVEVTRKLKKKSNKFIKI